MENSMLMISPYKENGVWVFDDVKVGLVAEPFILGMSEMIDHILTKKDLNVDKFNLLFSVNEFPEFDASITKLYDVSDGAWYILDGSEMKGWLCPAMRKYLPFHPIKLYVKII